MTRALLLLTGGRSVPDMLVVKYLCKHWHPDTIVNITTERGLKTAENFRNFVQSQFYHDIKILDIIDPYDEKDIVERCENALKLEHDAEWIMHCTTSPKVVGIYAHDVARSHGIPYWILDTARKQLVSLITKWEVNNEELFNASVKEYMGAYERVCEIPRGKAYQKRAKSWYSVAMLLLSDHNATQIFLQGLRKASNDKPPHPLTPTIEIQAKQLAEKLEDYGFLTIERSDINEFQCSITDDEMCKFLAGDWLEFYVWHEAQKASFADDCQWGHKIVIDQKLQATLPSNELDIALTYKGRLLIAECKTSKKPFGNSEDLDKLYSIANLLGGDFVKQVFITSCPKPDSSNKGLAEQFSNFKHQAEVRRISVITGDQLHNIGVLLRQEIGADKLTSSSNSGGN